jgi:hypothetical protein
MTNPQDNCRSTTTLVAELVTDYGVLESVTCRCSKKKDIGKPFCDRCWNALSVTDQRAVLSARPACNFGTAYWAASASLGNKSNQAIRL